MRDIRNSPEYNQWKNEVKHRDSNTCRRCGFENNLHVHHIKPFKKYPEFAIELDNGLTLCGNCHSLLRGKEESTDLQTFLGNDTNIGEQLKTIDGSFSNYLQRKLRSQTQLTRDSAASALFSHLKVYPNSLDEMLPLLIYIVDSENWSDEGSTKRQAIGWLEKKQTSAVTPKQQVMHDEYLELVIADEIKVLETRQDLNAFQIEVLKALKNPETAVEMELRDEYLELTIADDIAELEATENLDAFQTEVLEALKAVQAEETMVISRYERRVQQRRIEQQRIAEQERLRQENEKREVAEKRQQEIISEYGSLEAYEEHHSRKEKYANIKFQVGCIGGPMLIFGGGFLAMVSNNDGWAIIGLLGMFLLFFGAVSDN